MVVEGRLREGAWRMTGNGKEKENARGEGWKNGRSPSMRSEEPVQWRSEVTVGIDWRV